MNRFTGSHFNISLCIWLIEKLINIETVCLTQFPFSRRFDMNHYIYMANQDLRDLKTDKMHRHSCQTSVEYDHVFVTSNCGNANLLGVKPVRREVDHNQGSKGVCCNNGGSYSNSVDSDC